jgi:hypothetical protein
MLGVPGGSRTQLRRRADLDGIVDLTSSTGTRIPAARTARSSSRYGPRNDAHLRGSGGPPPPSRRRCSRRARARPASHWPGVIGADRGPQQERERQRRQLQRPVAVVQSMMRCSTQLLQQLRIWSAKRGSSHSAAPMTLRRIRPSRSMTNVVGRPLTWYASGCGPDGSCSTVNVRPNWSRIPRHRRRAGRTRRGRRAARRRSRRRRAGRRRRAARATAAAPASPRRTAGTTSPIC